MEKRNQLSEVCIKQLVRAVADRVDQLEAFEAEMIDSSSRSNQGIITALTCAETRSIRRREIIEKFEALSLAAMAGVLENL